jgi:uncharacterized protein
VAGIVVRSAHYPGRAPVDSYGNGGFRFAGMSHRGSLIFLPSGIYGWDPGERIDRETLTRVLDEADGIEVLLIGTGPEMMPLDPDLGAALHERAIVAETMSTGAAVRTFNVLLAEDRAVAAALLAVD